jgi:hypothetical protein
MRTRFGRYCRTLLAGSVVIGGAVGISVAGTTLSASAAAAATAPFAHADLDSRTSSIDRIARVGSALDERTGKFTHFSPWRVTRRPRGVN